MLFQHIAPPPCLQAPAHREVWTCWRWPTAGNNEEHGMMNGRNQAHKQQTTTRGEWQTQGMTNNGGTGMTNNREWGWPMMGNGNDQQWGTTNVGNNQHREQPTTVGNAKRQGMTKTGEQPTWGTTNNGGEQWTVGNNECRGWWQAGTQDPTLATNTRQWGCFFFLFHFSLSFSFSYVHHSCEQLLTACKCN